MRVTADNAGDLVRQYDIVADGSDNFATRHAVNAACVRHGKPLVSGAAIGWDAQIAVYHPAAGGLRVHLSNGLYANAVFDRWLGGWATRRTP